jgi:ABC-2 type transport system ATP-binding protein
VLGLDPTDDVARFQLGARLGYLPENGPLWADQTPRELLTHVARVRRLAASSLAIDRMITTCALEAVVDKPITKLSKGYRQRVGMAQALIHDPELLVLDEPTSGLDPAQILEVRRLVRALARDKTVLLSTHILREVEAVADDVLIIADGRIVFDGTLEALREGGGVEARFLELTGATAREGAA